MRPLRRPERPSPGDLRTFDRLFAAFLVAASSLEIVFSDTRSGPLAGNLALVWVMAGALAWRRTHTLLVVAIVGAGAIVLVALLTGPPEWIAAVALIVTASYAAGAYTQRRTSLTGLAIMLVSIGTIVLIDDPSDWFFPLAVFGFAPWLAGRTIRNQTALARELAEKADRAEHAREDEERRAIAVERSRIARELHDVLAHNLSVMVVQAGAARRVIDRDPAKAIEAAALIERTGRETLGEIRHLFGTVRRGEGEALSGPPSIARLDELARGARAAGLRLELRVVGEPVELPAGIDLTAYRIVQEALTNDLKHAGSASASVTVAYEPKELVITVEDDGDGRREGDGLSEAGGGHGLVGMRERAALYGGLVQAGRRSSGGFAVRARLPTRPLVPGAQLARAAEGRVPA